MHEPDTYAKTSKINEFLMFYYEQYQSTKLPLQYDWAFIILKQTEINIMVTTLTSSSSIANST